MTWLTRRILFNCANIFNGVYKSQPFPKCLRQMHLLSSQQSMVTSRLAAPTSTQHPCYVLKPIVYNPVRFKKNKRSRNKTEQQEDEEDENSDEDDDDDKSDLNKYKEGGQSDRSLTKVKVQTLRLDTVMKAGFGMPKA